MLYSTYQNSFARYAGRAGLPKDFTPHQLRHQFASALLAAGVPITDVSQWLGHQNINVTASVYSHLVPSSWTRGREALEALAPDAETPAKAA
jgi:integrase